MRFLYPRTRRLALMTQLSNNTDILQAVFWDMDGTLIDSEPYWHQAELDIAAAHGGYWDLDLAWEGSGTPVPQVAQRMVEHGCQLPVEEIGRMMIESVARAEANRMPWIPGAREVLESLAQAGVPSVLVTTSPRHLAQGLVNQAPKGAFAGFICGDDNVEKKPSPEPYLAAAALVGIQGETAMRNCVVMEDSMSGLRAGAASGAITVAQTGFIRTDTSAGPQHVSINSYDGVDVAWFEELVRKFGA